MNFSDPQLEECYARKFTQAADFSGEMRQVCALIAVHDFFQMMEGPHSARVHETIDRLRTPNLRGGLRDWYRYCGVKLTPVEIEFREQLSRLTRENLECIDMPVSPS